MKYLKKAKLEHQRMLWDPSDHSCRRKQNGCASVANLRRAGRENPVVFVCGTDKMEDIFAKWTLSKSAKLS